jgi:thiamine-phosphate pyrophosphorylase
LSSNGNQALAQAVEEAFSRLSAGLTELYGLYRCDERARRLEADAGALFTRCALEERLLRSRLGMRTQPSFALPEETPHTPDALVEARRGLDDLVDVSRELEEYFAFFKLEGVSAFYHKVRFEIYDLQRGTARLLEPDPASLPARRRHEERPSIEVHGRVRQALLACPLYFILDSSLCDYRDPVKLGFEAANSGVRMLQLRLKHLSTRDFVEVAQRLKQVCVENDCILIVNDRVDVAILSGADGVHLGENDPACADVRRIAPFLLIGVTVRKTRTALEAQADGADYLGCGSVYPSATKPGLPLIGVRGVGRIASAVSIPVVAIGGVTLSNAPDLLAAGAAGVCSVSEFKAKRSLRNLVSDFRNLRPASHPVRH